MTLSDLEVERRYREVKFLMDIHNYARNFYPSTTKFGKVTHFSQTGLDPLALSFRAWTIFPIYRSVNMANSAFHPSGVG